MRCVEVIDAVAAAAVWNLNNCINVLVLVIMDSEDIVVCLLGSSWTPAQNNALISCRRTDCTQRSLQDA
jgi:hypothetical protein